MKLLFRLELHGIDPSHSARSAWIETPDFYKIVKLLSVALRKECVD